MTQAPKPAKRFTGNSRCKGIRFVFGFRPPFWQRVRRVLPPSCPESFLRYTAFHLPAFRGAIHKAVMPIVGLLTCPPKTDPQVMLYQVAVYRQLIIQSKPVVEATNSLSFSKATSASTKRSSTASRLLKTSLANHFSLISSQICSTGLS